MILEGTVKQYFPPRKDWGLPAPACGDRPISFQAGEAGQNANRQNWHVKVHMQPNYNSKGKHQDCRWLGKGRFLSWGSSFASGYGLALTRVFTEETRFYRSAKCFQNQQPSNTILCTALQSSAFIFIVHNLILQHNCLHLVAGYGYIHLNKSYRKLHHCLLTVLCQHLQ